jgi:hypothetical protein
MWPWQRKSEPAAPSPAAGDHEVVRAPRADWRHLDPIQRVISDPPLINPVQRFSGSLTAWQDPSFLAPLAHVVHADEPSGVIPQLATPVPAADLPLAIPSAPAAAARPVQRMVAPTIGPSIVDGASETHVADSRPTSVSRNAPAVHHVAITGPTGRIEMPAALSLAAVPAPSRPSVTGAAPSVQRHADHDHGSTEPDVEVQTIAQRSADDVTVSRQPDDEPGMFAQTLSADAATTLPLPSSTPTDHIDAPELTLPTAPNGPRRYGLGEPLTNVPAQRSTASPTPPSATPVPPLPLAAPDPASSAPTIGSAAAQSRPMPEPTRIVSVGPPPMPLLPSVQRSTNAATRPAAPQAELPSAVLPLPQPVPQPLAEPRGSDAVAETAAQPTLTTLIGDAPPLLATPPEMHAAGGSAPEPGALPLPGVAASASTGSVARPLVAQRASAAPVGPGSASAVRTTAQLISESRTPAALTYATPAPAPATAGTSLSSLPIATASWVHPSVQRTEAGPTVTPSAAAPITVSRAVEVGEMTVEPQAGGDAAPGTSSTPAAGGAGGGDPAAMAEHLFDPLLARLKTELRLDRERRGSLTDLWH